ncbi:MAG: hypothetical protein JSR73_15730 [Proteobacteria bacterium]|nr:hypothetical protein [Pseudomonadota bacterium]
MIRKLPMLLLGALLAAGCGQRPPAPPAAAPPAPLPASARADAIRAAASGQPAVEGRRDRADGAATWRAVFAGDAPALVEESVAVPGGAPYVNRYYYEQGALFYYAGEQAAEAGSGAAGPFARVAVQAEFDGARARRAVRLEHYGPVPLPPALAQAIAARGAELAAAARDEHSARRLAP